MSFRLPKLSGACTWDQATLDHGDLAYAQYKTDKDKPPALVVLVNDVGNRVEIEYKTAKQHIKEMKSFMMLFCLFKLVAAVFIGEQYQDKSLARLQNCKQTMVGNDRSIHNYSVNAYFHHF